MSLKDLVAFMLEETRVASDRINSLVSCSISLYKLVYLSLSRLPNIIYNHIKVIGNISFLPFLVLSYVNWVLILIKLNSSLIFINVKFNFHQKVVTLVRNLRVSTKRKYDNPPIYYFIYFFTYQRNLNTRINSSHLIHLLRLLSIHVSSQFFKPDETIFSIIIL